MRDELRPVAERAASPAAERAIVRAMLARLHRSHFVLLTAAPEPDSLRGDATVPVDVRAVGDVVLIVGVEPASAADRAGLRPGDRLLAIGGTRVAGLAAALDGTRPPRLRELALWRRVAHLLSGDAGSSCDLTVRDPEGHDRDVTVVRAVAPGAPVTFGNLPPLRARIRVDEVRTVSGRRVGVIAFNVWMPVVARPFGEAIDRFRDADGLVIDLRGNPGGLADMIRGLAGHLLDEPALLGRMHMRAADLEFRANPRRSTPAGRRVDPYAGPVALLVDGLTASASECFAGGLQSLGRVRVFGVPTMGEALPAATRRLPTGDVLMYAVGDFVTSTGQRLEGRGVVPDETVPLSPAALAAGRDARAAALAWLDRVPRPGGR